MHLYIALESMVSILIQLSTRTLHHLKKRTDNCIDILLCSNITFENLELLSGYTAAEYIKAPTDDVFELAVS